MNLLPSVYIETTIPSLLAARESNDSIVFAQQQLTREWWDRRRDSFRPYISDFVIQEISKGDPVVAQRRLDIVSTLSELEVDDDAIMLASRIMESGVIPARAATDAAHIATAARWGVDYLLTWNCKHIANAEIVRSLSLVVKKYGYELPGICTPFELLGGRDDV